MDVEQIALLCFLREEIFLEKELAHLATSFCKYFIHTVKDDQKRKDLIEETKLIIERIYF